MDGVPWIFVESVTRSFRECESCEWLQDLSSAWGAMGEVHSKKRGGLLLTFAPYNGDKKDWRLHYKIEDFEHIKTKTLSREVVREMAKSIEYIMFNLSYFYDVDERWHNINSNDVDQLRLLINLDAPVKMLDTSCFNNIIELSRYVELRSKYSDLFTSFTSVVLQCFEDTRLMEKTISEPRVRSVEIWDTEELDRPTSYWVDLFFSEKCSKLFLNFKDIGVVSDVIDRWKNMDTRNQGCADYPYIKAISGIRCSNEDVVGVGMREVDVESRTPALEMVRTEIKRYGHIKSLHSIDHPVDPSSKIYVVFFNYCHYSTNDNVVLICI
uniref:FBA_2 domain-containing protein n=1 Tax=Steinernema glaseri TaxID=37863 RepID=A0A1I8ACH9_9BILA